MVQVKLSNEIVSIHGKSGGNYFKSGSDGQHMQAMPRVVRYARSESQMFGIDGYSGMAALWQLALLGAFWAIWGAFALAHYFRGKRITGYNWYIHYWLLFPEAESLPFWKPPRAPGDLPAHIVTFQGRQMFRQHPDDWPADSPAGYYWETIPWKGKPAYRTDDIRHFIWWNGTTWVLSQGIDFEPHGSTWYQHDPTIIGYFRNPVTNTYAHCYYGKRPGL